jgi:hypothetical protein
VSDIVRPQSPSASDKQSAAYRPDELNPELAAATLAKDLIGKFPVPSIISKKFAVYQGIWTGLNHVAGKNETGYDCSMRLAVYSAVARESVNIDGKSFNAIFTYLNKPKVIVQGMQSIESGFEEERPSLASRLWSGLTGRNKQQQEPKQ